MREESKLSEMWNDTHFFHPAFTEHLSCIKPVLGASDKKQLKSRFLNSKGLQLSGAARHRVWRLVLILGLAV